MQFDEVTHTYTHNNKQYISTTTLLQKFNLAPDIYNLIDPTVLAAAATRGTAIHKSLEKLVRSKGINVTTPEAQLLKEHLAFRNVDYNDCNPEVILYDTQYEVAGTADLIYVDNGEVCLIDYKTTSQIHYKTVSWQISIYIYMYCKGDLLQYYLFKPKVFWFHDNKLYIRDLPLIDYDEVVKLFEANKNNTSYTYIFNPSQIISENKSTVLKSLIEELGVYETHIKNIKDKIDTIINEVKEGMIREKYKTLDINNLHITYTEAGTTVKLDQKKLEEYCNLHGIDINQFKTSTNRKESIRYSIREDSNNTQASDTNTQMDN